MKIEGTYTRKRDKIKFTYTVTVRAAPGGAANWDSRVYADGDFAGDPGGQLLAPLPSPLFEDAIRSAVEGSIEAGLSMNR